MPDYESVSTDQKPINVSGTFVFEGVVAFIVSALIIGVPVFCLYLLKVNFQIILLICLILGFASISSNIAKWIMASNAQIVQVQDTLMTRLPKKPKKDYDI